jgi:hypothetical protein
MPKKTFALGRFPNWRVFRLYNWGIRLLSRLPPRNVVAVCLKRCWIWLASRVENVFYRLALRELDFFPMTHPLGLCVSLQGEACSCCSGVQERIRHSMVSVLEHLEQWNDSVEKQT